MSHYNAIRNHGLATKGKEIAIDRPWEPCAATASLFLYAEGSTIICLHHDSLTVERTFSNHAQDVQFICVDNVSERGAGRLVVSWDVSMNPIVWDLFTGEQISRLSSQEPLTTAAWMRNGNLVFGDSKGEVTLFEPASTDVFRTATIFDPITALAPSADCQTYAIGYQNGSILLAAMQPHFTVLHTLTSRRAPSPIAALTWHASSSKQKSDMLATYTIDGDLRVWSIGKPPTDTTPRSIRTLKQADSQPSIRNWICWSKNGRILQYFDNEVWAWDVKTKSVTYGVVQTVDYVRGIAAYGPTGTFFTLGPDHSIQQYDVDSAQMVQNVRRVPPMVPQTPPQEISQPVFTSESENEITTPASQSRSNQHAPETAQQPTPRRSVTPRSGPGRDDAGQSAKLANAFSPGSKTEKTATSISLGAQVMPPREAFSPASNKSNRKTSRLRQEVIMSPEERPVPDLFPYTRARLSDVPYRQTRSMDESHMTPDDLRRQMLSVVFGWDQDVDSLISDELARLPAESAHAVYLTRWLNTDPDQIAETMGVSTSSPTLNWMRLALSSIGDSPGSKKMAQVLVEQMLIHGDIHAAVAALIACGDWNDAVEVYVSRNHYMEAVLLACLLMPTEWQRLSFLVRNWGEHVVQKSDQHLAVRCFSCTGVEPSEPWTSPGAQMATGMVTQPPLLQPSIYHKTMERRSLNEPAAAPAMAGQVSLHPKEAPQSTRLAPPTTGLKLITSFGGKDHYKFPGLMSDEGTPINAALVTPIAESAYPRSAISPGGFGSYRANNMRSLNSAMASKPGTPGGLHRSRLPSIGETPIDNEVPHIPARFVSGAPPTPADSGSDKEKDRFNQAPIDPVRAREELPLLLTPARYEPPTSKTEQTPKTAIANRQKLTYDELSNDDQIQPTLKRNSSRSRKPDGLSLKILPTTGSQSDQSRLHYSSYDDPIDRPSTTDTLNSMDKSNLASPPDTGNSYSSYRSLKSPSVGGRSLDQYISSLEQAQYYKSRPRGSSITSKQSKDDFSDRKKHRTRDMTAEDARLRGEARNVTNTKRSPSSPVPMSPGELGLYNASFESLDSAYLSSLSANQVPQGYLQPEQNSSASTGERRKHRSRSRQPGEGKSRSGSQAASRRRSPDAKGGRRGRSKSRRETSEVRSPSSPEQLQPSEDDLGSVSSMDPALRIVSQNRHRLHSKSGRRQERSVSTHRQPSPERRSSRMRSSSRQPETIETGLRRKSSVGARGEKGRRRAESSVDVGRDHRESSSQHQRPGSARPEFERPSHTQSTYIAMGRRTKELAQAELEARRLSLQRRPSAPAVPYPGQEPLHMKSTSMDVPPQLTRAQTDTYPLTLSSMSAHPSFPEHNPFSKSRPSTPRAMKHPGHSHNASVPDLPNPGELLSNDVYRPPQLPSHTVASPIRQKGDFFPNPDIPYDMPKHPAFDSNIGTSRPTSRSVLVGRHVSPARGASRDRTRQQPSEIQVMTIGEDVDVAEHNIVRPPVVPELQHLAMPPPPPPPPAAPPREYPAATGLRLQTTDLSGLPFNIPLPLSAYPADFDTPGNNAVSPPVGSDARHRRGRSGSEHQIVGKIRNFAGRMRSSSRGRSTSRPRENNTKSPQLGSGDDAYSPYESLPNPAGYPAQAAHRELATVMEGR